MKTVLLSLLLAATGEDAGVLQKVYVQGSSVNLRKEPGKDAEVLVKAPIGTECTVTGTAAAEWMKVRCGDYEGYAAVSLVGPEKPSVEALKAEANNPMLTPEHREESALRAALLAPEDAELSKLLGELFFERNFRLLEGFKGTGGTKRTFSNTCGWRAVDVCLRNAAAGFLREVKVRAETRKDLFVVAVRDSENVTVYRGKYELDPVTTKVKAEVLERSSFPTTPVMDKAIFAGVEDVDSGNADIPFGHFVLDDASHALLNGIPSAWALLRPGRQGLLSMPFNDCLKKPYLLEFHPDIHGRWLMLRETGPGGREAFWITSVSKRDNELELSLAETYGNDRTRMVFKLPEGRKDIGYLNDMTYTFKLHRYAEQHDNCKEGGP
ncbi:SH3 domain-containing protein [Cystobacter ferrugineus]|uniref:SH3b domain-containing protein n=1 Tax=Cystobacter ferrugineus TaxID=83449 RepID=A0A1L9B2P2_9BACT|nr:SH3 domain-containing protein [Cystobacter ferrugineus]OJH36541.1 hypothetical protein BON30_32820 [Cystobacter ferrugineus]